MPILPNETTFFVGQPLKVLAVDTSRLEAERCLQVLQKHGYNVSAQHVTNAQDYASALSQHQFDTVLAEFHLPQWSASEALDLLRDLQQTTSFIVVTRQLQDHEAAQIIDQGADDYVLKNSLYRLPLTVRRALRERRLIADLRQAAEERQRLILKLESSLDEINRLHGLLQVCITCKRVLDKKGLWSRIENYIERYSDAEISPSLCPDCRLDFIPKCRN